MNDEQDLDDNTHQIDPTARSAWGTGECVLRVDLVHDTDIAQIFEGEPEPESWL